MTTEEAGLIIQPHPVRPMDPAWLNKFLTSAQMDQKKIKSIIAALNKYNFACNKAAEKFTEDLKKLK